MPAFLFEDVLVVVDVRVEDRIHVHISQVHEVGHVGRCHRIHGLIREGHGIQECLHAAFEQIDERLLHREPLRAAEHGMLQDVEDAGVISSRRLEGDGKGLVHVLILKEQQLRSADLMDHEERRSVYLVDGFNAQNLEA